MSRIGSIIERLQSRRLLAAEGFIDSSTLVPYPIDNFAPVAVVDGKEPRRLLTSGVLLDAPQRLSYGIPDIGPRAVVGDKVVYGQVRDPANGPNFPDIAEIYDA